MPSARCLGPCLLLAWLAPATALHAEETQEPSVKATAIALPHPGVPEETMVAIMRSLEGGMKRNPRLDMRDLEARLADFAQEIPQSQIETARQALKKGEQALAEGSGATAARGLEEAVAELARVLPYIKKQELADAMAALAVARFESGDHTGGRREFVRLLTWRPDFSYDPVRLPPKYLGLFEEAQHEVERAKLGALRIVSEPEGAQAYVDGRYYGVTPCTADQLPAGDHFVTLKKDGYRKAVMPAEVPGKRERRVEFKLVRSEKYLLVEQTISHVEKILGVAVADAEMDNLRQVLFVDHAAFVRAAASGLTEVQVDVYLYDLRTRRLLSHISRVVPRAQIESHLDTLATNLYTDVNYEGELALPKEKSPPKLAARKPLHKSWWFWTALVVAAGGIAGATTAIVLTQPASCPSGSFCPVIRY